MSNNIIGNTVDFLRAQDSIPSKVKDTVIKLADMKEEIIKSSEQTGNLYNSIAISDWLGYLLSFIFTLFMGGIAIYISRKQHKKTSEQSDSISSLVNKNEESLNKLEEFEKSIHSEVVRLIDINRQFKEFFPEIINEIKNLCLEAQNPSYESEFFIMNRTSSFGKIHTFNPSFISHYNIKNPRISSGNKDILKKLYKTSANDINHIRDESERSRIIFTKDIKELSNQIKNCGELLKDKFKLIVLNGENNDLYDNFIKDYLGRVNEKIDEKKKKSLIYYTKDSRVYSRKGGMPIKKFQSKKELEDKITESVTKSHNELINEINQYRNGEKINGKWLELSSYIPMQIYLLKNTKNNIDEYKTFIINAMNTNMDFDKDREIDGIYSNEKSIYSVFETLFSQTFKDK
ncbi:hypothetical protein IMCC3317_11250 [Kordia antarctica]|uniref:Uncharacterized protein n=1 Tax=Kordia antarctica TaxID=1218801 RepID=A0A7L4ZH38_9FLAO|nr:hypothetical protein [Kordia antarctica]QHI35777.1 hypothetical protein IMCC3317_11250 [Kordia antarctica]